MSQTLPTQEGALTLLPLFFPAVHVQVVRPLPVHCKATSEVVHPWPLQHEMSQLVAPPIPMHYPPLSGFSPLVQRLALVAGTAFIASCHLVVAAIVSAPWHSTSHVPAGRLVMHFPATALRMQFSHVVTNIVSVAVSASRPV